jgi:hypothetical protein
MGANQFAKYASQHTKMLKKYAGLTVGLIDIEYS